MRAFFVLAYDGEDMPVEVLQGVSQASAALIGVAKLGEGRVIEMLLTNGQGTTMGPKGWEQFEMLSRIFDEALTQNAGESPGCEN